MAERPHLPVLRNSRHAVVVVVEAVGKWATAALSQLPTCPQPLLRRRRRAGCFEGQVDAVALPFFVQFDQDRTDQTQAGGLVREDANKGGAAVEFPIDTFQAVAGAQPALMLS